MTKHIRQEGSFYFVTSVVFNRLPLFISPSYIIPIYDSLHYYRYKHQFKLLGYVIMPDHLHLLIWPSERADLSEIMRDFKKYTSVRIIRQAEVEGREDTLSAFEQAGSATGRSQRKVWQDDYWDIMVFSARTLRQKLNYIHRNPERAGLVASVEDYPYSSYRFYTRQDGSLMAMDSEWLLW